MITTLVLIKADPRSITAAATRIAGFDGVHEVYSVSGEWDLVAVVRVADYERIAEIVTGGIAGVAGVERTQTLTAFRTYSKADLEQAWDMGVE